MMAADTIAGRLEAVRRELPPEVELVAVSKFHPMSALAEAYGAGQRVFGESRVQELKSKVAATLAGEMAPGAPVPDDVRWHFIGHLQRNKVRQLLALRPALIESVDSTELLELIDSEAARLGIVQPVLLQAHVAREETKTGFSPEEMLEYFTARKFENLRATHICGLMGMASNTDDTERVRQDFATLRGLKQQIEALCPDLRGFSTLSMGMSHDRGIAVEEGSTMVRIGTDIFGEREY